VLAILPHPGVSMLGQRYIYLLYQGLYCKDRSSTTISPFVSSRTSLLSFDSGKIQVCKSRCTFRTVSTPRYLYCKHARSTGLYTWWSRTRCSVCDTLQTFSRWHMQLCRLRRGTEGGPKIHTGRHRGQILVQWRRSASLCRLS
jgi:hypothetical protein